VSVLGNDPIVAFTDSEHISVLISELLNNAHNILGYDFPQDAHTRPITVMLRNEGNMCMLTVSNDAAHPYPGELSSVFDLFQTTYEDRKHLGIGLGMCQAIASRYEGSLRVIEQPRGSIYSFTVELSLPRAENE
jgi:C4-dicarboxylate-specific signal transduction histidine kinase